MKERKAPRSFVWLDETDNHITDCCIKHGISRSDAFARIVEKNSNLPQLMEKSIKQYVAEDDEKQTNWKTAVRSSSRAAEQNTSIILELLNQLVDSMEYTPIDQAPSEAYLKAKREVKRKQDYFIRKAHDKKHNNE